MNILIENVGELLTLEHGLGITHNACVLVVDGKVRYAGLSSALSTTDVPDGTARLDAKQRLVTPGLVEPHAHPIFAGSRANEFALRAEGKTYLEIQAAGGGILSTVHATRDTPDDALVESTLHRLDRFADQGTTLVEAKTGYALSIAGEIRLLQLLRRVRGIHAVELSPTLLAHVPPPLELDGVDRETYVARFCSEAIQRAAVEKMADAVDVYCDEGAFTLDETRTILTAAKARGFLLRVHAEQFTHTGAADLAADLGARSVEHMEHPGEGTAAKLAAAGTVVNLLPGAAMTLRLPWPDARRFIAAGCKVALGTDCNPGSSLTESLPLMMSLAVAQMGMTVDEAWLGVTRHAAHAVGRDGRGHLGTGAIGDAVVWDTDDHRDVVQHFGGVKPAHVVIGGRAIY